jgi:hypothetical protein
MKNLTYLVAALALSASVPGRAVTFESTWGYNATVSRVTISGTFASNLPDLFPFQNFPYPG